MSQFFAVTLQHIYVMNTSANNKRIAKNTIFLYIRMALVMCVSLYTVRIVLSALGEVDYGLYNVIGGVVTMSSFLSATLSSASLRYFAFELGKGDMKLLNKVFCVTFQIYIILTIIIFVLSETIGVWYLNTYMVIPQQRIAVANLIFHFSVISYLVRMLATPFQSMILARERMNIYAYVGILEVFLGLILAYMVKNIPCDKLLLYGVFVLANSIIVSSAYVAYSYMRYSEVRYHFEQDRETTMEILSYSCWSLFSGIANIARSQGINLLLNLFFNPIVNAARGIAYQINNAIVLFSSNFYMAVRPQLTKYYAMEKRQEWLSLSFSSSKFCGYLILMFAIPLIIFCDVLLEWWLVEIPTYTIIFCRLVILTAFVDSMTNPMATIVQATGIVKYYHVLVGGITLLNLPIAWLFLKLGYEPQVTMIISTLISILALFARLFYLKWLVNYLRSVLVPVVIVFLTSFLIILFVKPIFVNVSGFFGCCVTFGSSIVIFCIVAYVFGLNKYEQHKLLRIVYKKILGK